MSIISTYPISAQVNLTDKLVGTDAEDLNKTKNYTVESIIQLLPFVSLTLPVYADNTAALAGFLTAGQPYRTPASAGAASVICVVY
jgi:hypothetical protein|tara:strand:+ start:163 stop:420 length:258 start_codon:yes stop_codon:yes gene_type:complete